LSVLLDYIKLRADTQAKNIAAWTPVVAEILDGFCRFDHKAVCDPRFNLFFTDRDMQFVRYLPAIYPLATGLLARDVAPEIRLGLKMYFERVGLTQGIIEAS
jgi:brefeldin A-inhibited guanine nucleotide-exchange protein